MKLRQSIDFKDPEIKNLVDKIGINKISKFLSWASGRSFRIMIKKSFSYSWLDKQLRTNDPGDVIKDLLERYVEAFLEKDDGDK